MEIEVTESYNIKLKEVFFPVVFENDIGERISVCQRDGIFEVAILETVKNVHLVNVIDKAVNGGG